MHAELQKVACWQFQLLKCFLPRRVATISDRPIQNGFSPPNLQSQPRWRLDRTLGRLLLDLPIIVNRQRARHQVDASLF